MDNLIETIRLAVANGATQEQRAAGATACRAVLAALDIAPGQPFTPAAIGVDLKPGPLSGLTIDHILDLGIAQLRSMIPSDQPVPTPQHRPLTFELMSPAQVRR